MPLLLQRFLFYELENVLGGKAVGGGRDNLCAFGSKVVHVGLTGIAHGMQVFVGLHSRKVSSIDILGGVACRGEAFCQ